MFNLAGFMRLLPLGILIHIIFTNLVMWKINYARLMVPERPSWSTPATFGDRAAATAILAVHFSLLGLFLLSAGTAWVHAVFHAPFWRPYGPPVPFVNRLLAISTVTPELFIIVLGCVRSRGSLSRESFALPLAFFINPRACSASARAGSAPVPPLAVARWQQAEWKTAATSFPPWMMRTTIKAKEARPNFCKLDPAWGTCPNGLGGRRDRMYHGHWPWGFDFGSCCLPAWDHYCPWVMVPVYLHTTKAYLLTLWYLVLYSAFVTAVMCFEASRKAPTLWRYFALPIAITNFGFVANLAGGWGWRQLNNLGLNNSTMYERKREKDVWVFCLPTADQKWILCRSFVNPWDQGGWYANLRHVMGDGWSWLVPFWQPRRVQEYDDQRSDYDEKYGPAFLEWRNSLRGDDNSEHPNVRIPEVVARRDRRGEASSSGIHTPAQSSRRRQQTSDQV